jgi:hypothetical protein
MKHFLRGNILCISFLIFGFATVQSQEVVNSGFENWQTISVFEQPTQWHSWPTPFYEPSNMEKLDTDIQDGDYAVKLITMAYEEEEGTEIEPSAIIYAEEPGEGIDNTTPYDIGVEFDEVTFYVKYDIQPGDAGVGIMVGYDGETAVGQDMSTFEGTQSTWQEVSISLPQPANKITLAFLSSAYPGMFDGLDNTMQGGSWLSIDNVTLLNNGTPVASQLPNNSFDVWANKEIESPEGWTLGDLWILSERDDVGVFKTTDAFTGNYAVELHAYESNGSTETGTLHYGVGTWEDGGASVTGRPMLLTGMYKFDAVNVDQASVSVDMEQNGVNIGGNWLNLPGTGGNYEPFAVTMEYTDELVVPDKIYIRFVAGNNVGSVLKIDDLAFAEMYQVTFNVTESGTNDPVVGAKITITGHEYSLWTDKAGQVTIMKEDGSYDYSISSYGYDTNEGNFVVDGQNRDVNVELTPFVPDETAPIISIIDMDHDKVYFDGDYFQAEITLPSTISVPDGTTITNVLQGIFAEDGTPVSLDVFQDGTVTTSEIQNNLFTISGTIGDVAQTGVIALGAQAEYMGQPTPDLELIPMIDTYQHNGDISDFGMALVGVSIPAGDITSDPVFPNMESLYNTGGSITFYKGAQGSVTFEPGLNIIDNRSQLNALGDGLNIVAGDMGEHYYAEINPLSLSFLSTRRAIITLTNIPENVTGEDITVVTTSFGQAASEDAMEANLSDLIDPLLAEGRYSFAVHGFSRYSLLMGLATTINKTNAKGLVLYPNPFNDVIFFNESDRVERVIINSTTGKIVLDQKTDGASNVNVASLPLGVYIVSVFTNDGDKIVRTLIKQ